MQWFRLGMMASLVALLAGLVEAKPSEEQLNNIWSLQDLKTSNAEAKVERQRVPLVVRSTQPAGGFPVTFGVPLPKEEVFRVDQMRVVDAQGQPVPCSITPSATWTPQGSLKWVLIDAAAPADAQDAADGAPAQPWTLEYGSKVTATPPDAGITVSDAAQQLTVNTGRLVAAFSKTRGSIIEQLTLDDQKLLTPNSADAGLYFLDQHGTRYRSNAPDDDYAVSVEFASSQRVVVKATGWYVNDAGERACRYITRVYLYRDQPVLRVFTTWVVTVDTDTMQWRDLGLRLPLALGAQATGLVGIDPNDLSAAAPVQLAGGPVRVCQQARGQAVVLQGEHTNWQGASLAGWLDWSSPAAGGITVAAPDLAEQFPIGVSADAAGLTLHAFSPEAGHLLGFRREDVQARYGDEAWNRFEAKRHKDPVLKTRKSNGLGLARTHEWILTLRPAAAVAAPATTIVNTAALMLQPPLASATAQWNCASGAFGPYNALDLEHFGDMERRVQALRDEWRFALRHMEPHYGFYDYGRGIPYHLQRVEPSEGKVEYQYSGYRRNYDLGYGSAIVPWLMYLRSGERDWLDAGTAIARHEMDVRHIHPTGVPGTPRIGFKYWHYGTWSFDGSCLGFQDHWYKNLALCFYVTGYQRALDVFGEIMESCYDAFMVGKTMELYVPTDRTGHTSMAGSVAVYYKATWDPRFRAFYEGLVPSVLATQREDGVYEIRAPWMEQFFQESLYDLPDPPAEVIACAEHLADGLLRTPERNDQRQFHPFIYWWAYQRLPEPRDPLVAAYAHEHLAQYMNERYNLLGNFGPRHLLYMPLWQKLALVPGGADAELPQTVQINRPADRPLFFQHTQGKLTKVDLSYLGEGMHAFTADGQPAPEAWLHFDDSLFVYQLRVPADAPTQRVRIVSKPPVRLRDKYDWLRLPWWPERDRTTMTWTGENPLVDTPLDPPMPQWELPTAEDRLFPSGKFDHGVRLSKDQRVVIDLGDASADGHLRQHFDSRQGTLEFFARYEAPNYGTLLTLPIENPITKPARYEHTLWLVTSRQWDLRMYNRLCEPGKVLIIYRQNPQINPGQWHHVALIWDWNDRDNASGKIMRRLFLDGFPGPVVSGGGEDSRTYWLNSMELPSPARFLSLGQEKPTTAVTIDELRISNIMRYPFGKLGEQVFTPPTEPFALDEHTLVLHHFDHEADGSAGDGSTVPIRYVRQPGVLETTRPRQKEKTLEELLTAP